MASGLALAAGAAPFSFPWLTLLAVPALGWALIRERGWRGGFGLGWLAGTAFFAGSMYWIVEPFFVDIERHGWMAPFAISFLAGGLALFWGAAFALSTRFRGRSRVIALVCWWTLAEFVRAHIFTGFPWGQISYGWAETPVFQMLAFAGPHGLTLATLLVASLPVLMREPLGVVATAACVAAAWMGGTARMQPVAETGIVVRLIQPNAPQHLKWHPDMVQLFWDRAVALTERGTAPNVVVWPETSVPFLWGEAPRAEARMVIAARGAHLIVGHRRFEGDAVLNALLHIDPTGAIAANYDKHHLVPFGEYIPLADLASKFGIQGLAANDGMGFAAGPGPQMITVDGLPSYLPLICYEAIFPGEVQIDGRRPDWLLHLTNDAWFGQFAGPYQHLVQARARAIEQGLPVARAANTGVSAMIDPFGRVLSQIPLGTDGALDARLPQPLAPPPYTWLGEGPWLMLATGMFFGIILRRRSQKPIDRPRART